MKFSNDHDEWLHSIALEGGLDSGGNVEAPTGWYARITLNSAHSDMLEHRALKHYEYPDLLMHESNEGIFTVYSFRTTKERDDRFEDPEQAFALWDAGIAPESAVDAITAYRAAALWSSTNSDGVPLDGLGLSWSERAHRKTKAEVIEFITSNIRDLVIFMGVIDRSWGDVGHDFWLTRNGHGTGFWDRGAAGEVVDRLVESCKAWGEQTLEVSDVGEVEVL